MRNYRKYVNALFLLAAVTVWFLARHYVEVWIGHFQLGRQLGGATDVVIHALPLLLGVITFVLLQSNSKIMNFTTDSVGELVKVVWPTKKDIWSGTVVVVIAVVLSGLALGVIDMFFSSIIRSIIGG